MYMAINTKTINQNASKHRRRLIKKYIPVYLLLIIPVVYYIVFCYTPMFGLIAAFKDVSPYGGIKGFFTDKWVGLLHYKNFFGSVYASRILRNTILISLKKLLFGFTSPIVLALLLNELRAKLFKKVSQTISYLPHFLSTVIICGLVRCVLSTNNGLLNEIICSLGGESIFFLGVPKYFHGILVISSVWSTIGWNSIIYLAALTGIDPGLYEAAYIDGASGWQRLWHVTLPGIAPIITIMLIMQIGNLLNAGFEQVLLLYSSSVLSTADIIDTYVYREGIVSMNYSYSTAIGLFKSVFGFMLVALTNVLSKRLGQEGIW